MRLALTAATAMVALMSVGSALADERERIDTMANPFKPEINSMRLADHVAETCREENASSVWFAKGTGELEDYCLCIGDAWVAKEFENDDIRDFCRIRAREFIQQVARFTKAVEERKAAQKKRAATPPKKSKP